MSNYVACFMEHEHESYAITKTRTVIVVEDNIKILYLPFSIKRFIHLLADS